jgi:tetratricopeptide (TPR) repeat protein
MFRIRFAACSGSVALLLLLGRGTPVAAQHQHGAAHGAPATLLEGLGRHTHPIATKNAEAQKFFDQGLTLVYGFNHNEAIRAFEQAARLDAQSPMPHWGIALSLGENINSPIDPERAGRAYSELQLAQKLAANGSDVERAYVAALSKRYTSNPSADPKPLAQAYAQAMKELCAKYPDDLDAATLYAESMMDLRPWALWAMDGTPAEGTLEIVRVLEGVLARNPDHPGANHYYIHAIEASAAPERALPSAARLETLVPSAGHLVHMPAHIYMRTGDYQAAAQRNEVAADVDRKYIAASKATGLYPMMYYTHNLDFIDAASDMAGAYAPAAKAAQQAAEHVEPFVKDMPMVEAIIVKPFLLQLHFARWDEVLATPRPASDRVIQSAYWHYARAVAFAAKKDLAKADAELKALKEVRAKLPEDLMLGNSAATRVIAVAEQAAIGRVALARGNNDAAIDALKQAVALQDALQYDEPPAFHYSVRESLGAALLRAGKAADAEAVFRDDLARNRRSGRALFGLWHSLKAQQKNEAAELVRQQYEAAWKGADATLTIDTF